MDRPSDPVLKWLRSLIQERGMNSAQVAEKCGLERQRVRRILKGSEPMLLDEMMRISDALEIQPTDMGLAADLEVPEPPADAEGEGEDEDEDDGPIVDPYGNQPEQLFRVAFGLGCDFFFLVEADVLQDSGVPEHILAQYSGRELPIKLDAAYHQYNDPRYAADAVTLTLSFDQLYECTFPWSSVRQVIFFPAAPDSTPPSAEIDDDGGDDEDGHPHLRLVT
jgi:transcriptional regulator with XRE-family HTH domain